MRLAKLNPPLNPWPMVVADLRALRWTATLMILLIALGLALGLMAAIGERALRASAARATDDFDLIIAAPGSQTQIVLTAVYLQLEALPLLPADVLPKLQADPRVEHVAPIAYGDVFRGYPVIGTTASFVTRFGRVPLAEGRVFANDEEAVIGADVQLPLGARITPSHAAGPLAKPGVETAAERDHRHAGQGQIVVGRSARHGSPWDRAILIPLETVWAVHGLGTGHTSERDPIGPPWLAGAVPRVPLVVVKPRTIANAYSLRGQWRQEGTTALFPAEVLVSLYRTIGDVRRLVSALSLANQALTLTAIVLALASVLGLRRQRYAVLRALGAPRLYVFLVIWLTLSVLIAAGVMLGCLLGWLGAALLSGAFASATGFQIVVSPALSDFTLAGLVLAAGILIALPPAWSIFRQPIGPQLRN